MYRDVKFKSKIHSSKQEAILKKQTKTVRFNEPNSNTKQIKSTRVTFVVMYHTSSKSLQSLINKHLNILYLDENA